MTKISEARERYEEKVCKDYLGIPESYCADEFEKLISNMKAGIMAVKGSSSVTKECIDEIDKMIRFMSDAMRLAHECETHNIEGSCKERSKSIEGFEKALKRAQEECTK